MPSANPPTGDAAHHGMGDLDPSNLERYARSLAQAAGLAIDDDWWPGIVGHLGGLLERADGLAQLDVVLPDDPAPVFEP